MNDLKILTEPTVEIRVYLAGDLATIERCAREYCMDVGFCVTVTTTKFIYKGGEETGVCLGVVNYPRFPSDLTTLHNKAMDLTVKCMEAACQWTALIVAPEITHWLTRRKEKP